MTDITKIAEALRIGQCYAQEVLSNHDQWAQGHPATLDERKAITDDIDAIKSAVESLAATRQEPAPAQVGLVEGLTHDKIDDIAGEVGFTSWSEWDGL